MTTLNSATRLTAWQWLGSLSGSIRREPRVSSGGLLAVGAGGTGKTVTEPAFDGLLVSWAPGTPASERAAARQGLGLSLREEIHTPAMQSAGAGLIEWVSIPSGQGADAVMRALAQRAGVQYAEKNWRITNQVVSNDTYYTNGSLWGMYSESSTPKNQFGSKAADAWAADVTGSADVYVGIIDEGYQYTHPDLNGNAGVNPGEIAGNGQDDDGNSYIDDVYGWDFNGNNNTVYDGTADDHGTHVAGTIGARGGNGAGVAGINWTVKLLNAKFLGNSGGSIANAIKAVDYFTDLKTRGINLVATNNSWGGGGYSQGLHDAIIRAANANILFVAAAGNSTSNNDTTASYPSNYNSKVGTSTQPAATYDNVIAVASINSSGGISSFSSYGASTVDLGAPGEGIWSTVPSNSYASYSGTSMATPHVTGSTALLRSAYPLATAEQIKQALLDSATLTPTLSLANKTLTGGRLNLPAALNSLGALVGTTSGTPLPVLSVSVSPSSLSEGSSIPAIFQLTRSGDASSDLQVNLLWQGSASNGTDYSPQSSSVLFPAGTTTLDLPLTPIDDTLYEGDESVSLKLSFGSSYAISPTASTASLVLTDNDPKPAALVVWGTTGSDTRSGGGGDDSIGGVTQSGTDTGQGTVDTLTGLAGADRFVLADTRRGTFYNDGSSRSQGSGDYALITDFKTTDGDKVQLRSGSQYLFRNSGSDTQLFLSDGNNTFSSSDEYIALLKGVNLAPDTRTYSTTSTTSWAAFV